MSDDAFPLLCALVLEDGRRLGDALVDVQESVIRRFLDAGSPPFHYWTFAKGWGKTTLAAALAVAEMLTVLPAGARLFALARDAEQGRLLLDSVEVFRSNTEELAGALLVQSAQVIVPRSGSTLTVLPADAEGAHGARPDRLYIDEWANWPATPQAERLYDAASANLAKTNGRMLIVTTAGSPSSRALRELENARHDPAWSVHEQPGPAPWTDPERLAAEERRQPTWLYRRLWCNEWAESADMAFLRGDVLGCIAHHGPLGPRPEVDYVLAVDLGWRGDATAICVAHGESTGDEAHRVVADRVDTITGTKDREVDLDVVEERVAELAWRYEARIYCDPRESIAMMQRLRRRGLRVDEHVFSMASNTALALRLLELIRARLLAIPDDDDLVDELVALRITETGPGLFKVDTAPGRHDDRAVALGMAAVHLVERGPSSPAEVVTFADRTIDVGPGVFDELPGRELRRFDGTVEPISNAEAHREVFGDDTPDRDETAARAVEEQKWRDLAAKMGKDTMSDDEFDAAGEDTPIPAAVRERLDAGAARFEGQLAFLDEVRSMHILGASRAEIEDMQPALKAALVGAPAFTVTWFADELAALIVSSPCRGDGCLWCSGTWERV